MQDIETKQFEPHQLRVIQERKDLDWRLGNLNLVAFFASVRFAMLPQEDKDLLKRQADVMAEYSRILSDRIARF